eukprot:TRINITY_DN537_c0_g1_i10.p1 TRINITY_DN537_c0_g1~~TRINITY_DN537_c0_g1_i10.p1  ORF type:complete len:127 (+),score=9.07 TRINITY_DN537_c0_g1_i10:555-935(+)
MSKALQSANRNQPVSSNGSFRNLNSSLPWTGGRGRGYLRTMSGIARNIEDSNAAVAQVLAFVANFGPHEIKIQQRALIGHTFFLTGVHFMAIVSTYTDYYSWRCHSIPFHDWKIVRGTSFVGRAIS